MKYLFKPPIGRYLFFILRLKEILNCLLDLPIELMHIRQRTIGGRLYPIFFKQDILMQPITSNTK